MNFIAHPIVFKSIEHPLLRNCQLTWKLKSVIRSLFSTLICFHLKLQTLQIWAVYMYVWGALCARVCVCVYVFEGSVQLLLAPSIAENILKGVTMSPFSINDSTFSLPFRVWVNLAQVPPGLYLDPAPHLTLMESVKSLRYYFYNFQ